MRWLGKGRLMGPGQEAALHFAGAPLRHYSLGNSRTHSSSALFSRFLPAQIRSDIFQFPFRFNRERLKKIVGMSVDWIRELWNSNQRVVGSSPSRPPEIKDLLAYLQLISSMSTRVLTTRKL